VACRALLGKLHLQFGGNDQLLFYSLMEQKRNIS